MVALIDNFIHTIDQTTVFKIIQFQQQEGRPMADLHTYGMMM